jgi:pimeloyl-ACP methyl ester carboxylesterase
VNQFVPEIRPALGSAILESDQLGATWGDGQSFRAPLQNTLWGWNRDAAQLIDVPTLIIRGQLDTTAPEPLQRDLFADLGTDQKVFVSVACASHNLVWENQHMILLLASREWLREGTFQDRRTGSFFVDAAGRVEEK